MSSFLGQGITQFTPRFGRETLKPSATSLTLSYPCCGTLNEGGADPLLASESLFFLSKKNDGIHFTELLCTISERPLYVKSHLALAGA